jgi:antitoxin HigA-1
MRIPKNRNSTHPGEMLLEEFLIPMGLTQRELADAIQVPFQRINQIVSGKRGITPSTALRLGKFFAMSPGFWLNLQMKCDLQAAERSEIKVLRAIRPRRSRPAAR